MLGLIVLVPALPRTSVYPSGAALAAISIAKLPAAPGRFSTIAGWPSTSASFAPTSLPRKSPPLPAANGTMRRMGRLGYGIVSDGSTASLRQGTTHASTAITRRRVIAPQRLPQRSTINRALTPTSPGTDPDHPMGRRLAIRADDGWSGRTATPAGSAQ